jgi:hypothetical protein
MSVNLTYLINPKFHFPLNQYNTAAVNFGNASEAHPAAAG